MSKLKIRFLKHYEQFDETLLVFEKDEVISLEEASSMHYVNRGVAVLAKPGEKIGKPKKQEELPVEVDSKTWLKILNWFKKSKASDEVDLESLDVPELRDLASETYPGVDLPQDVAKGHLIAFVQSGDVSIFAKPDEDSPVEDTPAEGLTKEDESKDGRTIGQKIADAAKSVVSKAKDEPVTDEPVADALIADEPVADTPVADTPVADEPVADEPVADEPVESKSKGKGKDK